MDHKSVIDIADLKEKINLILTHIAVDLGKNQVPLVEGFYWDVSDKDLYSTEKERPEFDVGSLVDDLDFLVSMSSERDQAVSLMLLHVAPILRYLALKVGQ